MIKINEQTMKNYLFTVLLLVTVVAISNAFYSDLQRTNNEKMMLEHFKKQDIISHGKSPEEKNLMDYMMLRDPDTNLVPFERLFDAEEQAKESRKLYPRSSSALNWESIGPTTSGGRTRAIMMDPNDLNGKGMWLGSVSGGLWYIDDVFADSYTISRVDSDWSNISVTSLTYDPNDTNILYAGSGERVGHGYPGVGIWKSVDAGQSWTLLPSPATDFDYVEDVVVRNENGISALYASIEMNSFGPSSTGSGPGGTWHNQYEGVVKSTDGGSSWAYAGGFNSANPRLHFADLHLDANNRLWAGGINGKYTTSKQGGHLYFTDDGVNWSQSNFDTGVIGSMTNLDRVIARFSKSNPNIGYAIISNTDRQIASLQKTADNGANWTELIGSIPLDGGKVLGCGQANYDLSFGISPTDPNYVYFGCLDVWRSTDGASNWTKISDWPSPLYGYPDSGYVHADQHSMINVSADSIIFANDGGVFISKNASSASPTFDNRIENYTTGQFYHGTIHPETGKKYALGGTQDNGSWKVDIDNNIEIWTSGGDGAYTGIDKVDHNWQVSAYTYNTYYVSNNSFGSSTTFNYEKELSLSDTGWFINPFIVDGSTKRIYAPYDENQCLMTSNYTDLSTNNLDAYSVPIPNLGGYAATSLALSPFTDNVLFVGSATGGYLYKITNASQQNDGTRTVTEIGNGQLPSGWINSIDIGHNDNQILVSISNFGVDSVWETKDGGSTWIDLDDNSTLPDMPVRWAVYERSNTYESSETTFYNTVFLATEKGVWRSNDVSQGNSTAWFTEDNGMPNVSVHSLSYRGTDGHLVAATFGNGLWYSQGVGTPSPTASAATFAIDSIDNSFLRSTSAITVTPDFSSVSNFTPVSYQLAIGSSSSALNDVMDWTTTTLSSSKLALSGLSLTDYTTYYLSLRAIGTAATYNQTVTTSFNTYKALLGDFDADWDIDINDMNAFVNAWPSVDIGPAAGTAPYMTPNLDSTGDIADMNVFSRNWFWSASNRTINKILSINNTLQQDLEIDLLTNIITIQIPDGISSGRIQIEKPKKDTKFSLVNNTSNMIVLENDNDFYQLVFGNLDKDNSMISIEVSGEISELNIAYEILDSQGENETNMIIIAPPSENKLYQNYPNPFSGDTTIQYDLVDENAVDIYIYNSVGKLIRKIDEGSKSAGSYSVVWDGRSDDGDRVSSGVYFYQIQTKDFNKTMKMLFVK